MILIRKGDIIMVYSNQTEGKIRLFRDGIFSLHTRRFGTVAELMIKKMYNLEDSSSLAFDKKTKDSNKRIEIKFATALKMNEARINEENLIDQCNKANFLNRAISSGEIYQCNFDCNIQQIKIKEFDELYYGIFFSDVIEIFKMPSTQILNCQGYSNKQHRGNDGEGQFHINQENIEYHHKKFKLCSITYNELYDMFLNNKSN